MISHCRFRSWVPAIALLALVLGATVVKAGQPLPGGVVALVFPPWWQAGRSVAAAAAEGLIIRVGRWDNVVVVQPNPVASVGESQAWLRLNPIMAGCGVAG